MTRPAQLSFIIYALFLTSLLTLRGEFIALAIPFALILFYSIWSSYDDLNLSIERKLSTDRATPNLDVTVSLTITNNGADLDECFIEDILPADLKPRFESPSRLIRLKTGIPYAFSYIVSGPRGLHPFESVRVSTTDLFGLSRREKIFPVQNDLVIFPEMRRLKRVSIRPRATRVYAGNIPARVGGVGAEFFGVREYKTGDSPRTINWRASARHMENLYSTEYQQERVADVGIVLDARVRANLFRENISIFEHSVSATAALSDALIFQGNRVGLLVYGSYLTWALPGYGKYQREKIMRTLAKAREGVSSVFAGLEHLSPRMFPPESQIVLVSTLANDDLNVLVQLRARGYQVMVVSPDPVSFELNLLPDSPQTASAARIVRMERDLLIRRMERAGIQVVGWDVSIPLDQAIGPVLTRIHSSAMRRSS